MIRQKMISINVSVEVILRNTFALEYRIYQKKRVWRNLTFGEKAVFLHLASSTRIIILLTFSARWKFSKFWLIEEENL